MNKPIPLDMWYVCFTLSAFDNLSLISHLNMEDCQSRPMSLAVGIIITSGEKD